MSNTEPPSDTTEIDDSKPACSPEMEKYFSGLERAARECYSIASKAREMGLDPVTEVEMPLTADLASRVESLVGPPPAPVIAAVPALEGDQHGAKPDHGTAIRNGSKEYRHRLRTAWL